jgi:DNA-binding transcriptional ArsR family regulator
LRKNAEATRALIEAALAEHGMNLSAISRATGVHRRTVQRHLQGMGKYGRPRVAGRVRAAGAKKMALPAEGQVARYIVTCATNNTRLHEPTWRNLEALAAHWGARILVSRVAYNTNAYRGGVKPGSEHKEAGLWYDERIVPHACDERVELAPGLAFCGEVNISPTATRPLSGLETYAGRASSIFPHPKLALESVPAMKGEGAKFCYTTGAVTQRNYVQSKAGQKAEHHHVYGALVVEVNAAGQWWVRQLNAEDGSGRIQDLGLVADGGEVTTEQRVEALVWGDFHTARMDPAARALLPEVLHVLHPRYQFIHDLLDFQARNHHESKDWHRHFELFTRDQDGVEHEVWDCARVLREIERPGCRTVVVDSNHDHFFGRWLREADYRKDPRNARYFLEAQLEAYRAIEREDADFHLVEWALRRAGAPARVVFLRPDESFRVARGRVECGIHGHDGPDGARGTPANLSRLARRMVTAHTHKAGIRDGVYTVATFSDLYLNYNRGPSSRSHSFAVVYPSGKRAILTLWAGRPWA